MFKIISTKEYNRLKNENDVLSARLDYMNGINSVRPQDYKGFIEAVFDHIHKVVESNVFATNAKLAFFEKLVTNFLTNTPESDRTYLISKFLEVVNKHIPKNAKRIR